VGNFIAWVAFGFAKAGVVGWGCVACRCHFGSVINSILNGYRVGYFLGGVKHPEPEADHTFTVFGQCLGQYLLSPTYLLGIVFKPSKNFLSFDLFYKCFCEYYIK
jgi:hypothetical protein